MKNLDKTGADLTDTTAVFVTDNTCKFYRYKGNYRGRPVHTMQYPARLAISNKTVPDEDRQDWLDETVAFRRDLVSVPRLDMARAYILKRIESPRQQLADKAS
jgi:hypothetical protein